jgi:ribosome-associated protein
MPAKKVSSKAAPSTRAKPKAKPVTKPKVKAKVAVRAKVAAKKASNRSSPEAAKKRSFLAALDREMAGSASKKLSKAARRAKAVPANEGPAFEFAVEAARLLRDDKCEDVVMLDVRGMSQITDYVIIGSGTSERQMRSILNHVEDLGATRGFQAFRSNTDDRASWVLVDFVDVVVHLFEPNTRAHYDLETLWPDARKVQWERADQLERDRAGLHV